MGRLGADPDFKETASGIPYAQFRLANNAFGDPEDTTAWFTVTVWDGRCTKMVKSLKKGSLVEVEGDYSDRIYTSKKSGGPEIGRDITASAIYFAGSGNSDNNANPNNVRTEAPATDGMPAESRKKPAVKPTVTEAPAGSMTNDIGIKPDEDLPF